ncbi:MAG: fumarylacetoacetate hydrolase family protein [Oscillospiraceae bacterium]|nr:fumarylacetoacetate hydrolase family protein [Oscillospiraceae bacterium]
MRDITDILPDGADLTAAIGRGFDALRSALSGLPDAAAYRDPATLTFGNVAAPRKIVCCGLNYTDHARETGGEPPQYPVLFSKFNDALAACGEDVILPSRQRCYDYEAEVVVVVGKRAYNVAEDDADDYIFGYTCGNDLSARDSQFLSNQWLAGKSFPGFAPAGAFITTRDEWNPEDGKRVRCTVNGERRQDGSTADMIFSCRQNLAAASKYFPLDPGDLIFTGTPAGVILGKPKGSRVWLKPGDTVTVEIEGLGALTNRLAGE